MIVGWRAYFCSQGHGEMEEYSSADYDFDSLPRDRCLGVCLFEDKQKPDGTPMRTPLSGYDWYFKSGEVYGCDNSNRLYEASADIRKRYNDPILIRGMWTTHDLHMEMIDVMKVATCP